MRRLYFLVAAITLILNSNVGLCADVSGVFGIQYGSSDFRRDQSYLEESDLDLTYSGFGGSWSVRLQGQIVGPTNGPVKLKLTSNERVQVQINGKVVLDTDGASATQLEMKKGARLPLVVELRKNSQNRKTNVKLEWSHSGQPFSVVGGDALVFSTEARDKVRSDTPKKEAEKERQRPVILPTSQRQRQMSLFPKQRVASV